MTVEPETREQGTIVSMGTYAFGGCGHIRAEYGDTLAMFYWSVIEGFHTLRIGQRVKFSRATYGFSRKVATLVTPALTEPDSN